MDEMKIKLSTKLMKDLLTRIVRKVIKKKYGCDVCIHLNDLSIELSDGRAYVHLNVDADMDQNDLMKVMNSVIENS